MMAECVRGFGVFLWPNFDLAIVSLRGSAGNAGQQTQRPRAYGWWVSRHG